MDHCPAELLHRIALFACTDGGRTGCSLSLVSRYFRDVTQLVRYQSVALTGEDGIKCFANITASLDARANVYHLFIGVYSDSADEDDDAFEHKTSVIEILRKVARTLITLFVHIPSWSFQLPCVFPMLEDLTIPYFCEGFSKDENPEPSLPRLLRLHVTSYDSPGRLLRPIWVRLATSAPTLEQLRISGFKRDGNLENFIRAIFDVPRPEPPMVNGQQINMLLPIATAYPPGSRGAILAGRAKAGLPRLKRIYLQPGVYEPHPSNRCGTDGLGHYTMIVALSILAGQTEKGQGNGVVRCFPRAKQAYGSEDAWEHWLDVIHGGNGAWGEWALSEYVSEGEISDEEEKE